MDRTFYDPECAGLADGILSLMEGQGKALALVSRDMLLLRQTKKAASLLKIGYLQPVGEVLSELTCQAVKQCLQSERRQTVCEQVDGARYQVEICPAGESALLCFSPELEAPAFFEKEQYKARNYLNIIQISLRNIKQYANVSMPEGAKTDIMMIQKYILCLLRQIVHQEMGKKPLKEDKLLPGDLSGLLKTVAAQMSELLKGSSASLSFSCKQDIRACFSAEAIYTVVYGLISNSLLYGGETVNILLSAGKRENGTVYFSVEDDGPGFQEDKKKLGSILLMRSIAAGHKGTLLYSGVKPQGIRATFSFPQGAAFLPGMRQPPLELETSGYSIAEVELSTWLESRHFSNIFQKRRNLF